MVLWNFKLLIYGILTLILQIKHQQTLPDKEKDYSF